MSVPIPLIRKGTQEQLQQRLLAMAPHFTPEWVSGDDSVGTALIRIFAALTQETLDRLNRTPNRNMLAFLDTMGIRLIPKSSALAYLTFHVTAGITEAVLVPSRTLVTAGEVPFETETDLNANPGSIASIVGVDPANDKIYQPPQGFLQETVVGPKLPDYTTVAFSNATSNTIQLDLVEGIAPGDTLRIDGADYVVQEINGQVVKLVQPLTADVNTGITVSKRTAFELFNGLDLQSHILYLSHSELFQMKEEAQISLRVVVDKTGDATDIVWEVFTEDKYKVQKWVPFTVLQDTTSGLSRSGNIDLLKLKDLEIKETPIGGQTARWIRARRSAGIALLDRLSTVKSVQLSVSSHKAFQADAAFYNETPLPVETRFNPLGFEPQLFDRFQIASAEAFSKVGAIITLDFTLDMDRLLGAPTAVVAPATVFRVFARGVLTRLTEVAFSKNTFLELKNSPPPTAPGAFPAAVALPDSDVTGVFVRTNDNSILLLIKDTIDGPETFVTLDKPGGNEVQLDPAAVPIKSTGEWLVFAVAGGQVWHKRTSPGSTGLPWVSVNNLGFIAKSAPAVALDAAGDPVLFVFDDTSQLRRVKYALTTDWIGTPDAVPFPQANIFKAPPPPRPPHPFAMDGFPAFPDPTVFFVNADGKISAVRGAAGVDLGAPTTDVAPPDPTCVRVTGPPDHLELFAPGGGKLYKKLLNTGLGVMVDWDPLPNPQPVSERPYAISVFDTQYRLFVASSQGSILQLATRTESGFVLETDSTRMLFLGQPVPLSNPGKPRFAKIPTTPASGPLEELKEDFAGPSLALFTSARPGLSKGSAYTLFEQLDGAITVAAAGSTLLTVELTTPANVPTGSATDLWMFIDSTSPEFVSISSVLTLTKISVTGLAAIPAGGVGCKIFHKLHDSTTARDAQATTNQVLLDFHARRFPHAYDGAEIQIKDNRSRIKINSYDPTNLVVELESKIGANGDPYSFPDQWIQLQDPELEDIDPQLSWEFWNGKGWTILPIDADGTEGFVRGGRVKFKVPEEIATTEVAGQNNYWIRARLVGGDYGQIRFETTSSTDTHLVTTFKTERKDFSRPPIVNGLTITYSLTKLQAPKVVLTLNNLDYIDQTAANLDKSFEPFTRLDTKEKSVYLGFEQQVSSGSVLFTLTGELPNDGRLKLLWEAVFQNQFQEIDVQDDTAQFTRAAGVVNLDTVFAPERRQFLGAPAYWTRARLVKGDWPQSPELSGVFFNAVAAKQRSTYVNEVLGPSDGTSHQVFEFQHKPVFEEEVRIRTQLTEDDRKRIVEQDGEDALFDVTDEAGHILETWVLWKEVPEFADSKFDSRHYRLDRAAGQIQFGDRVNGAVPPIGGDNIRAFRYRSGGGLDGNVDLKTINSLVTATAGIDVVSNPLPASGGSEEATRDEMIEFGPSEINSRERAVAATDYEFLARQASRLVVKARCIPNQDNTGAHNPGWVSVYIVAASTDPQPQPPLELCNLVRSALLQQAPAALAASEHIFVGRPDYIAISVTVRVAAVSITEVARAEANTRNLLAEFLHPLTGGPDRKGWDFGQGLALSELYSAIEQLDGVDHVDSISVTPALANDYLEIGANQIVASGDHKIEAVVAEEAEAWR